MSNLEIILGNLLILCLYSFPMSFAENWAFGNPKKGRKRPEMESAELNVITDSHANPAQENSKEPVASIGDWATVSKRLPKWAQGVRQVKAGLATGGCLMVLVVVVGAVIFALYYQITGQPELVSQIIPRFAYWFPFALLGLVCDIPFQIFYWEDKGLRVLLRMIIWWFPRIVIVAFMFNLSILQELDPATTALTVLAIDVVLAAYCLELYAAREQMEMRGVW